MAVQIKFGDSGSVVTVKPGDTITVTVDNHAIAGHILRGATDFANALGCEAKVTVDRDLSRRPAPVQPAPAPAERPVPTEYR